VSKITNAITGLFARNSQFKHLVKVSITVASQKKHHTTDTNTRHVDVIGYLNLIHPYLIHVVSVSELNYLYTLSTFEQNNLIKQLVNNGACHIVFLGNQVSQQQIPLSFLTQKQINVIHFEGKSPSQYNYLLDAVNQIPIIETSIHGCMTVIFNQGILITGNSGSGKSTLLVTLLERGHLWVADDAPNIYINNFGELYGEYIEGQANGIPEYIHVKNVGAINVDQTFGKTKRIPRHTLAAIIHLSDNVDTKNTESPLNDSVFSGYEITNILGKQIPKWSIPQNEESCTVLVECIARQLILNSWGENTTKALHDAHNAMLRNEMCDTLPLKNER